MRARDTKLYNQVGFFPNAMVMLDKSERMIKKDEGNGV